MVKVKIMGARLTLIEVTNLQEFIDTDYIQPVVSCDQSNSCIFKHC